MYAFYEFEKCWSVKWLPLDSGKVQRKMSDVQANGGYKHNINCPSALHSFNWLFSLQIQHSINNPDSSWSWNSHAMEYVYQCKQCMSVIIYLYFIKLQLALFYSTLQITNLRTKVKTVHKMYLASTRSTSCPTSGLQHRFLMSSLTSLTFSFNSGMFKQISNTFID